MFQYIMTTIILSLISFFIFVPPVILIIWYFKDRHQSQHSVLRNFPLLGRTRYVLEMLGPELRQYLFDSDREGKPFSRVDFKNIVISGKYLKPMISFGSKRDFDRAGFYINNSMFPKLAEEMDIVLEPKIKSKRYVGHEGIFYRKEKMVEVEVQQWRLKDKDSLTIGSECRSPWRLQGIIGMSAMSYGALGENAISAISSGLGKAGSSWMNTGEGGLTDYHFTGGGDIIMQIGPGLFGVRKVNGDFDPDRFMDIADKPEIKMFELKLGQGAKMRGGHVEGVKVTEEIAGIRGLMPGITIDSPNRHFQFHDLPTLFEFIDMLKELGGKPVGIKIVIGSPSTAEKLASYMSINPGGPDAITVDGGEGGSGATYKEMADSVGLPLISGLAYLDNALRNRGVRDRVKIFASGKLFSPDRIAIALGAGADLVNIGRGFMISVGCIGSERCHTNRCPVGVATTDKKIQKALVVEEKQWRVLNYLISLRNGLNSLASAAGLDNYTQFSREHVVYKDDAGRVKSLSELFPLN